MQSFPQPRPTSMSSQRRQMVREQLRARGISDQGVLSAMGRIPREEFVPADLANQAYDDCPLPIGYDQTISQPYTVAVMCQALGLTGAERVLEIGTGSGYGAAILGQLSREVYTVERIPALADMAEIRLARLGYRNVHVVLGDGTDGLPDSAPYDGIVVTASAGSLPEAYVEQLAPGGRIVIPIGNQFGQTMSLFARCGDQLRSADLGSFAFVPLVGKCTSQGADSLPW